MRSQNFTNFLEIFEIYHMNINFLGYWRRIQRIGDIVPSRPRTIIHIQKPVKDNIQYVIESAIKLKEKIKLQINLLKGGNVLTVINTFKLNKQ